MIETVEQALKAPYHRTFIRDEEDDRYTALVLEWPGCISQGDDITDANRRLEDAMSAWASVMIERGQRLPQPLGYREHGALQRIIAGERNA